MRKPQTKTTNQKSPLLPSFFPLLLRAIPLFSFLLFAACGTAPTKKVVDNSAYEERPLYTLYTQGQEALRKNDEKKAVKFFEEVDRQYPSSDWAVRAQIMAAFAYYQYNNYAGALASLNRFLNLYPGSKFAPYATYLRALCYYEQISDHKRDQETTRAALQSLEAVVKRFPSTPYATDAKVKIALVKDRLAAKHMEIARYYQRRKEFVAAINRFRRVVDDYQTTSQTPEALHRLTESYLALGLVEEAKATAAVLGYNYPQSAWYQDAYALFQQYGWANPNLETSSSNNSK